MAEVTLHLKGVTLRAREASEDMVHSLNLAAEDLARQVKRHREKRRKRREAKQALTHGWAWATLSFSVSSGWRDRAPPARSHVSRTAGTDD